MEQNGCVSTDGAQTRVKRKKGDQQTEERDLTEQELNDVAGGYIYDTGDEDEEKRWVVIDSKGEVFKVCRCKVEALFVSKDNGLGKKIITTEELQRLRETGSID